MAHQRDDRVDVVALDWIVGYPIGSGEAAYNALVEDYQAFARAGLDAFGPHHPSAPCRTVAGFDIHVLGPQASRAMVAVAPVAQRRHGCMAVFTRKSLVLGGPADDSASRSKK